MRCKFSQHEMCEIEVRLNWIVMLKCEQFIYLNLMFQENCIMDNDVPDGILKKKKKKG